ncbi:MAG: hypothetical protein P8182_08335 [Deltaproteobacteria bacterium]
METMSNFFESLNTLLGVKTPGELLFNPIFIGICIAVFIYCLIKGWKFFSLTILGLLGGALIFHYFYPEKGSDLTQLVMFLAVMGGLLLVLIYLGFVRE